MKTLLIFLISLYQRFISPYKGYRCAHAAHHRGPSCSVAVKAIIAEHGPWRGYPLVRRRFAECGRAALQLEPLPDEKNPPRRKRRRKRDNAWCCRSEGCGEIGEMDCDGCPELNFDGCGGGSDWD